MLCVSGRGRHSFSVSAEVPGKRAGTVNELDDRRCENEVHLCVKLRILLMAVLGH